jgi:release factor glutamine methyltransferase
MQGLKMTSNTWLKRAERRLQDAGISTAHLDCLVLLEDVTGKDRSWLLAHPETPLQGQSLQKLDRAVERRARHEPLAYIRGKTEFYGRGFIVNADTLEPRPESETMIELALEVLGSRFQVLAEPCNVIDVGTGSGALGITLKLEEPAVEVFATDISKKCLDIAEKNATKHSVRINTVHGNLLEPLYNLKPNTYHLILANLPYVPDDFPINDAAMFEPKIALFGGTDGLGLYRKLFTSFHEFSRLPQFVLTESLPFQHEALASIATTAGYRLLKTDDFIQVFEAI